MKNAIAILAAAVWISLAEFIRTEFFTGTGTSFAYDSGLHHLYADRYSGNAIGFWALVISLLMFLFSRKFNLWITTFTGWLAGFILMWAIMRNAGDIEGSSLAFIVPLSLLETMFAAWIIFRISRPGKPNT